MISKYRSDIDGLRAVAVGGVVIFHAFPSALPGGFIGVDVFFVLSGFLITAIIASEAIAGTFSITGFYERRFRRILPALAAVLLATTAAAVAILPPGELRAYGTSLAGVAVFASNIVFWRQSGYFDTSAVDKPLLHTWSLAVEEQFYIVWPLIAVLLIRMGRRRLLGGFVWATIAVSLIAAIAAVRLTPDAAFYMLPYRAWELGFGALLAVAAVPAFRTPLQREAAAWIGLALIVVPMFAYSEATPFPGLAAVPPCLGTLLIVHAGQGYDTRVGRILSFRPVLYIGLISYSFYLWHWPLLSLPRIALSRPLTVPESAAAVAAAFVLAALSLRFVEKPFRGRGTFALSRSQVLLASGASLGLLGAIGVGLWQTHGLAALASPRTLYAERATQSVNPLRAACHIDTRIGTLGSPTRCIGGARRPDGGYTVLLWGDSHADHLGPGLSALGREQGFSFRQASASGCSMLALVAPPGRGQTCTAYHESVLAEAARTPGLRTIVVSGRWARLLPSMAAKAPTRRQGIARFRRILASMLQRTRQAVGPDVRIVLVGSTPEFSVWPATCFARYAKLNRDDTPCRGAVARDAVWSPIADQVLASFASDTISVALPRQDFCSGNVCRTVRGDEILLRDDDHLTNEGSLLVARRIGPSLR